MGGNWIRLDNGTDQRFWGSLWFYDNNTGWGVGGNTRISYTENGGITNIKILSINNVPKDFILEQNYPNPFNPKTNINFQISMFCKVKLVLYDYLGREINTLVDDYKNSGSYQVEFSAENMSSGIYFYRLIVNGNLVETKKMTLLK